MHYTIIHGKNSMDLELKINVKIGDGYTPLGGPFVTPAGNLAQAMIKTETKKLPYEYKSPSGFPDYEANR